MEAAEEKRDFTGVPTKRWPLPLTPCRFAPCRTSFTPEKSSPARNMDRVAFQFIHTNGPRLKFFFVRKTGQQILPFCWTTYGLETKELEALGDR